jgi:transcriptional regulator with PAS, ATPase and Fis domain
MSTSTVPPPDDGDGNAHDYSDLELIISCQGGVLTVPLSQQGVLLIGRDSKCDIVIQDESVSRRHAVLTMGPSPTLEDLESTNGTSVMGSRVSAQKVPFPIGSAAQFGVATVVLQRKRQVPRQAAGPTARPSAPNAASPVVADPVMQGLYRVLGSIAPTVLSVLILGETGTGKELFAEAIHERSPRRGQPFLKINCGALPETILESELFGHEKGAFTGAAQAKTGLFEAADGGTIFLDEVGELPRLTQMKLLRVLESGEVLRIGSVKPKRVDVRLVSATNRDLNQLIAVGEFRMDLLYRINGFTFTLPPLRERLAEIPPLARHFAVRAASRIPTTRVPDFTPAAMSALECYAWPGNIRELRNVIDRSVALCPPEARAIDVEHLLLPKSASLEVLQRLPRGLVKAQFEETMPLPKMNSLGLPRLDDDIPGDEEGTKFVEGLAEKPALRDRLQDFERERITEALERSGGHQGNAAKLLGISRRTLFNKLEQYQIARGRKSRE